MSFLGSLLQLGGMFVPGFGKGISALGGLLNAGGGNSGAGYLGEAEGNRKLQLSSLLDSNKRFSDSVQAMDLSPDKAVENLHKMAGYYTDLSAKNAGTNATVGRMLRSTDPGVQLTHQTQRNNLDFANAEEGIRNAATTRQLGIQDQLHSNDMALSNAYAGQVPGLVNQGMLTQQQHDAQFGGGMQNLMKFLSDPSIAGWNPTSHSSVPGSVVGGAMEGINRGTAGYGSNIPDLGGDGGTNSIQEWLKGLGRGGQFAR